MDKDGASELKLHKTTGKFRGGEEMSIPFFPIPEDEESFLEVMKSYFYISSKKDRELDPVHCLVLYVNIIRGGFLNHDPEIQYALEDSGFLVHHATALECRDWLVAVNEGEFVKEETYVNFKINGRLTKVLLGINWNFIAKNDLYLEPNYHSWIWKKFNQYCINCFVKGNMNLSPSLLYFKSVNKSMAVCFPLQTTIFRIIKSLANTQKHGLTRIAKVTMMHLPSSEEELQITPDELKSLNHFL